MGDALTTRDLIERHIGLATDVARIEIVTALQQPARRLIAALNSRIHDLREVEAIEREFERQLDMPEGWGQF